MKILVVTNTYPPGDISGVGSLAQELLEGLEGRAEIHVLTRRGPEAAGRVHSTGGPKLLFPLLAGVSYLRSQERFDVVHVNESDGVVVALALRLSRWLGRRGPRLCVSFQVSYHAEGREVRALRVDGRVVSRPTGSEWVFKLLRAPLLALAGRLSGRLADHVIACSRYTEREIVADYGIAPEDVTVVANGIKLPQESRPGTVVERPEVEGEVVALFAGRLRTRKAVAVLLEAMARPEARGVGLIVVGDGEQGAALRQQAARLGLGRRVLFAGMKPRAEVAALYPLADIFVLPSTYEGFPVAILEAMAAGLPVVATSVAGVPEAIDPGVSGLLVAAEDAAGLARALAELAADPERRKAMGAAARRAVAERFAIGPIGEAYLAVWRKLAES